MSPYALPMHFRPPSPFLTLTLASASLTAALLAWFANPMPRDDAEAYQRCLRSHPQRYCEYAHLPSKYEAQ